MFKKMIFILISLILMIGFVSAKQYMTGFLPTDRDVISNIEYISYQSTRDKDESFYIVGISTYSFRYGQGKGESEYATAWANKASFTVEVPFDLYK